MCLPIFSGRLTSNLRQWYGLPTDGTATTVWWEEEPDPLLASSLQMPTSQSLVPSLSFRFFSPLSLRSNSEKNAVARKFLRVNQPKPDQHLVYDFQLENHHFLWFIVNKLRELFIQGPAKTFSMSKLVVWSARRGKRGTNSIWTLYGPMVASLPCNNGRWRFIAVVSLVLLIAFCGVMTHCFSKRRLQSPFLSAFVIWSRPSLEKLVFDFKTTNRFQYGFHCMSLFTATRLLNKSTKAGLLENVMGFQRVMNKILKVLSDNLPEYLGYEIMAPTIPNYILWSPCHQKKFLLQGMTLLLWNWTRAWAFKAWMVKHETSMHWWCQLISGSGWDWVLLWVGQGFISCWSDVSSCFLRSQISRPMLPTLCSSLKMHRNSTGTLSWIHVAKKRFRKS